MLKSVMVLVGFLAVLGGAGLTGLSILSGAPLALRTGDGLVFLAGAVCLVGASFVRG